MNKLTKAASALGSRGGKAGRGKAKARTTEQARKAAKKRWETRKLLEDAATALADLGACDDPGCTEPGCLHILQRIKSFLA